MLKSIEWNIYNILIVALVPSIMLTAWGLFALDKHNLHTLQCNMASEWLDESEDLSARFQDLDSMGQTTFWLSQFEDIESPNAAGDLRWGIIQSVNYHQENYPDMPTDERGVLNPPNGLFERQIEEGAEDLIDHCPDTEERLPAAFPMVFREGDL